ncbi:MAG TPA: cob(I)yrinic acid a,c-diamide adenosyltransferase [Candidatus Eisenbergiella merdipullorum]|uniref:Cob(I)yrinic acid a,c-diamide adenosyltransferase n=1 Tax=Candidatus Eisenbergiella merdipullorum TaxID=2838553 RepID=A0A9D2I805_9FIRM|nr:cob(I)yrinic acid a,c-diamide adenosyltransferase [Candidatus Eisenbergiella merdipullorum]
MEKGLIHLYTGEGKGKTTAAVGLAVRAAGAGKKVAFVQFMKGRDTGELHSLCRIPGIEILRSDRDFGFYPHMTDAQKEELTRIHNSLLKQTLTWTLGGEADVVVLDEVTYPLNWNLLDETLLRRLLSRTDDKPYFPEIVCTGRDPQEWLVDCADYVTRMECVKHPFDRGIGAREGIEY